MVDHETAAWPPNVKTISQSEMAVVTAMHEVAQKYDIALACARCRQPFQGLNDRGDRVYVIECGCRALRAVAPKEKP